MNTGLVVFRADASIAIGTGHVMRCLTLADELQALGFRSRFICREHAGHLAERVRAAGHELALLPLPDPARTPRMADAAADHGDWLGNTWDMDARQAIAAVDGAIPDWIVVDHYGIDARWERALRPHCAKLAVIDDLADRAHDSDLLLDQNLGRTAADYEPRVPRGCAILTGPEFALLRPEFARMRVRALQRRGHSEATHLLVCMGGVDAGNATSAVLRGLQQGGLDFRRRVTVVLGGQAPWVSDVKQLAGKLPFACDVRQDVGDMATIMCESDLALGAAGSTSWERCSLGLPSVVAVTADNQRHIAAALAASGAARVVDLHEAGLPQLGALVESIAAQPGVLAEMSRAAAGITAGEGARLVARKMEETSRCA